MRKFKTEARLKKITDAAIARQFSLKVVLENIHDLHNVSAIFRSCDAVGVPLVSLLYTFEKFPKINRISSASANKWVDVEKFDNTANCIQNLKQDGYTVFASMLDKNSVDLYDIDFTKKIAIILGNEHRGVSEEVAKLADSTYYIPMKGMIQSLNVSVAAAVTLYEAYRQRFQKGMYNQSQLDEDELNLLIDKWCSK
ncbi:MAG: RNA methyltransferase [Melioribacteraceae bacterium]|jgi:tRNA (guanosine-2'-O-)-methyltransferase|nr:RNA methyltransferase [Melioribacteraceae bacterium]